VGLLSFFRRDRRATPQQRLGTGLWRQHRERFSRAVDRFYTTVSTLHEEHAQSAAAPQIEDLAQLTLVLNALDQRIEALAEACHRAVPLDGLVFPADGRARLGDVPEHLSRASALVAQAAQSAAMLRAHLTMHGDAGGGGGADDAHGRATGPAGTARFAESARGYVDRAADLIAEAEAGLPADLRSRSTPGD
jgi:hypothetical protein